MEGSIRDFSLRDYFSAQPDGSLDSTFYTDKETVRLRIDFVLTSQSVATIIYRHFPVIFKDHVVVCVNVSLDVKDQEVTDDDVRLCICHFYPTFFVQLRMFLSLAIAIYFAVLTAIMPFSLFLFFAILSVLSAPGCSISCIQCINTSDDSCSGPSSPCSEPDQVCVTSYTVSSLAGLPVMRTFMRLCGDPKTCFQKGSLTVPLGQAKVSYTCCTTDNCTSEKPILPPDSTYENGVKCEGCISKMEAECHSDEVIKCTGKEIMCLYQITEITGDLQPVVSSIRGCATKVYCNEPYMEKSFEEQKMTINSTCSGQSRYPAVTKPHIAAVHPTMARSLFLLLSSGLALLAVPCYSLTCIECKDISESCNGPAVACPKPSDVCISSYTVTSMGGVAISKLFMRDCGNQASCNQSGSVSTTHGAKIKIATTCCSTDRCTPGKPSLPPDSFGNNGIVCKSCVSSTDAPCETDEYIQCTGKEVKCISQVSKTTGPITSKSSMRGCATEELCKVPYMESSFGSLMMTTETKCSDGCAGLRSSPCLIFLTTILILKFIYHTYI
ncbi:uncharacterized protein PAF06_016583 [Gastrophryne carolinensis]